MNKIYRSTYKSQSLIALAFNVLISSLAVIVVSGDKKIVTHCGISRFFLKTIFCILADETYQLIPICSAVAEQVFLHIYITSVRFVVLLQIKLIKKYRFFQIISIPAGA